MMEQTTAPQSTAKTKKYILIAIQICGVTAFIYVFFRSFDLAGKTFGELKQMDFAYFGYASIATIFNLLIGAYRLKFLTEANQKDKQIPISEILLNLAKANALNSAVPMSLGDVLRVKHFYTYLHSWSLSALYIFLDRLLGLGFLVIFGIVGYYASELDMPGLHLANTVAFALAALACGGLLALYFLRKNKMIVETLTLVKNLDGILLLKIVGTSALATAVIILNVDLLARAVGITVGYGNFMFIAPAVGIFSVLPLTVGGIGLREGGYALLLSSFLVPAEKAVALGIAQYVNIFVITLLALPFFLTDFRGMMNERQDNNNLKI